MQHLAPAPPQPGQHEVADPGDRERPHGGQRRAAASSGRTDADDLHGDDHRTADGIESRKPSTGTGSNSASGSLGQLRGTGRARRAAR